MNYIYEQCEICKYKEICCTSEIVSPICMNEERDTPAEEFLKTSKTNSKSQIEIK